MTAAFEHTNNIHITNQLLKIDVIDFETLINEVALLRNRYLGIMKSLESKNFMLGHVVRLRAAGMEDIQL